MRFVDKSRNIRLADLEFMPSDASFELSQAPPGSEEIKREKKVGEPESSKRGMSVAASTNECAEHPITLKQASWGPRLPHK